MFRKIIHFFIPDIDILPLELQKKSRYLLNMNSILMLFFLLVIFIRLFVNVNYTMAIGLIVLLSLILTSLILMHYKKYNIAAIFTLLMCELSANAILYTANLEHHFELYKSAFYMQALLMTGCLIVTKEIIVIIFGFLNTLSITVMFIVRIRPYYLNADGNDYIATYIFIVFAFIVLTTASFYIIRLTKGLVKVAEDEADLNARRFFSLETAIESFKDNMEIGGKLVSYSYHCEGVAVDINNSLNSMKEDVLRLNKDMDAMKVLMDEIKDAAVNIKNKVGSESSIVSNSNLIIDKMTGAISNIADLSESKRDSLKMIIGTVNQGSSEVNNSVAYMDKVSESVASVLEMIKQIENVAVKTNILAMNASIEAAHAGEAGRGFSVVAHEIRRLSDETNRNTKIIVENLKKNAEMVNNLKAINLTTRDVFNKTTKEVVDLTGSIEVIINNIGDLSAGTGDINRSMKELVDANKTTGVSVNTIDGILERNQNSLDDIVEKNIAVSRKIEFIVGRYAEIINKIDKVSTIGRENIDLINNLDKALNSIKEI